MYFHIIKIYYKKYLTVVSPLRADNLSATWSSALSVAPPLPTPHAEELWVLDKMEGCGSPTTRRRPYDGSSPAFAKWLSSVK